MNEQKRLEVFKDLKNTFQKELSKVFLVEDFKNETIVELAVFFQKNSELYKKMAKAGEGIVKDIPRYGKIVCIYKTESFKVEFFYGFDSVEKFVIKNESDLENVIHYLKNDYEQMIINS